VDTIHDDSFSFEVLPASEGGDSKMSLNDIVLSVEGRKNSQHVVKEPKDAFKLDMSDVTEGDSFDSPRVSRVEAAESAKPSVEVFNLDLREECIGQFKQSFKVSQSQSMSTALLSADKKGDQLQVFEKMQQ